jgi:hypothetical protein
VRADGGDQVEVEVVERFVTGWPGHQQHAVDLTVADQRDGDGSRR